MPPPVDVNITALNAILDRTYKNIPSGDGPDRGHFDRITGPLAEIGEGANALHKLHLSRDPNETDAVHFKRVATAAKKLAYNINLADSAVKVAKQRADADVQNRTMTTLRLNPDGYAAEIRAVYRQMSQQQRTKLLEELMESTLRGPELAAILRAPGSTTGMSDLQREQYYESYRATHAKQEIAEEKMVEKTFEVAIASLQTAREIAAAYTDERKLADIAKREAEAAAARQNFDAKVRA